MGYIKISMVHLQKKLLNGTKGYPLMSCSGNSYQPFYSLVASYRIKLFGKVASLSVSKVSDDLYVQVSKVSDDLYVH